MHNKVNFVVQFTHDYISCLLPTAYIIQICCVVIVIWSIKGEIVLYGCIYVCIFIGFIYFLQTL